MAVEPITWLAVGAAGVTALVVGGLYAWVRHRALASERALRAFGWTYLPGGVLLTVGAFAAVRTWAAVRSSPPPLWFDSWLAVYVVLEAAVLAGLALVLLSFGVLYVADRWLEQS